MTTLVHALEARQALRPADDVRRRRLSNVTIIERL
jgi:hypothetical protein